MAKRSRSQATMAWLHRQAIPQEDGTFLVRPFYQIPLIYEIDAATKDRLVKFKLIYGRFALICSVVFFVLIKGQPWALTWGLAGFAVVIMPVGYGGLLYILRGAKRVSRHRWVGPIVIDRFSRHSRRYYLIIMFVCLLIIALLLQTVWFEWRNHMLNFDFLWGFALVFMPFVAGTAFAALGYRRTAYKRD